MRLAEVTLLFPQPDPAGELLEHVAGVVHKVTDGRLRRHDAERAAGAVLDAVPDGWAKIGGRWVELPGDMLIEVP